MIVTSDLSFATLWLVPRLGAFATLHPEIDLVLDPSHRLVDFAKEDVDLGIRYGNGEWLGVDAKKIVDAELSLVCSPAFLAAHPLSTPADLDGTLLLQETAKECWKAWLDAAGILDHVVPSGPTLNGDLAIAAAEAGQGFALADQIQVGDALIAKRLVRPFEITTSRRAYYLVHGTGKKLSDAAVAFESWLFNELDVCNERKSAFFAAAAKSARKARKTAAVGR